MVTTARPFWKGNLKLSLVNCPVRLYSAINPKGDLHFNFLHEETHNRIKMVPVDPELGEVSRADLVKGYEYKKGKYVVLEDEDFEKARVESTHTINLESFIPAQEIDCLHRDAPYYLVPDDSKEAQESYQVIREAMLAEKRIGIGRVVLGKRERLVGVSAASKGFFMHTLRTAEDLRNEDEFFSGIKNVKVPKDMVDIARQIVAGKSGHFQPEKLTDHYEEALMKIIKAKIKGEKPVLAEEPEPSNVINLRDALRRSLQQEDKTSSKTPRSKPKSTSKKAIPRKKAS